MSTIEALKQSTERLTSTRANNLNNLIAHFYNNHHNIILKQTLNNPQLALRLYNSLTQDNKKEYLELLSKYSLKHSSMVLKRKLELIKLGQQDLALHDILTNSFIILSIYDKLKQPSKDILQMYLEEYIY